MANLQWSYNQGYGAGYGTLQQYHQGPNAQSLIPLDDNLSGGQLPLIDSHAEGQTPLDEVYPQDQATQNGFWPQAPQDGFGTLGEASFPGGPGPADNLAGPSPAPGSWDEWAHYLDSQLAYYDQSAFPQQTAWSSQLPLHPQQASSQLQQQQPQQPQLWFQPAFPQQVASSQLQPQQPQELQLSFEQKKAQFRQVPDLQADPDRKSGSGRPKKPQRFWAPENADSIPGLKDAYEELQTRDGRVQIAERNLAKERDPKKIPRLERTVLKNMGRRQEQWERCECLKRGLPPDPPLSLQDAEDNWKKAYADFVLQRDRYITTNAELATANPDILQADNTTVDKALLIKRDKKSCEGLQTKLNWCLHKRRTLNKCFESLSAAQQAAYGQIRTKADVHERVRRMHQIGGHDAWLSWFWPGNSQLHRDLKREFANPDPSTWGTLGQWHDNDLTPGPSLEETVEAEPVKTIEEEVDPAVLEFPKYFGGN